ncbi:Reaction center protein H chain [Sphingomonas sp. EC-HK361]|uniref:photosynthetic reaction center subunit H n=1 Tax=Sphingomonas sp. EC-HK361 TaxID=2038397 RepID=UPI0012517616|nr:photosynthetic reaction center subunit H [Sphingomonas sp. EC-HK361]VVS99903.1 Reaction center protein H chain [Sphingomonas sp. EC-HK361]
MHVQITQSIDVALLVFWAFVLFFICLVFYLRREDRREGYPLEDTVTGRIDSVGGALHTASTKTFYLPFGRGSVTAPTKGREPVDIAARRTDRFPGAPLVPTGNPLADGIGPAAWADRAKHPDLDWEGKPRIVPISAAGDFWIANRDRDPRGMSVFGADGKIAGRVTDLWIDKADRLIRYLQLDVEGVPGSVLAPMTMAKVKRDRVIIDALNAHQFAGAPGAGADGTITLYEEDRVQAYFGGGYLYANDARQEPFL